MSILQSVDVRSAIMGKDKTGFISSPGFDYVFFIFSPVIALIIGLIGTHSPLEEDRWIFGTELSPMWFGLGVLTFSHLFLVFFRSHANPQIFPLYPVRFIVVPIVLILAFTFSPWLLVIGSVLATFWDVYHSGMQTFGLGRIYDMKAGNDPHKGRRLDQILNTLIYAGPIAAGATLMDHVEDFNEFEDVGSAFFTAVPAQVESQAGWLSLAVIAVGIPFLIYYFYAYWRMSKQGYTVSPQKVMLLGSLAFTSILSWGLNPFGIAFFVMNAFHAIQYFAIVWLKEKGNIAGLMGVKNSARAKWYALAALCVIGGVFGVFMELYHGDSSFMFALFLTVSLLHFWYDGFIWSVRAKQV